MAMLLSCKAARNNVASQVSFQRSDVDASASSGSAVGLGARRHASVGFSSRSFGMSCKQLCVQSSAPGLCRQQQFTVRAAKAEVKTQAKVTKKCYFDITIDGKPGGHVVLGLEMELSAEQAKLHLWSLLGFTSSPRYC